MDRYDWFLREVNILYEAILDYIETTSYRPKDRNNEIYLWFRSTVKNYLSTLKNMSVGPRSIVDLIEILGELISHQYVMEWLMEDDRYKSFLEIVETSYDNIKECVATDNIPIREMVRELTQLIRNKNYLSIYKKEIGEILDSPRTNSPRVHSSDISEIRHYLLIRINKCKEKIVKKTSVNPRSISFETPFDDVVYT